MAGGEVPEAVNPLPELVKAFVAVHDAETPARGTGTGAGRQVGIVQLSEQLAQLMESQEAC